MAPALAVASDPAAATIAEEGLQDFQDIREPDPDDLLIGEVSNDQPAESITAFILATKREEWEIYALDIAGLPTVGHTITSTVEFSRLPYYVAFQWFVDDAPIECAECETLVLTETLLGKTIVLGIYAESDELKRTVENFSNEIGPVMAAGPVVKDIPTDNEIGRCGPSLLILGAGAFLSRRRIA